MELIDQHAKRIMEECRGRAEDAGLEIKTGTLEYIVTNRELLELQPKYMIPTLYSYWVDDVGVVRNKWVYDAYPHNPLETVINTRPAISFYNDNNPDWLNAMIFYHVLAHIDFFQNNVFFGRTWDDDFCGQALADKRLLGRIREELGAEKKWVDYTIEFARGLDNLVGFYGELEEVDKQAINDVFGLFSEKVNFYFGEFLSQLYEEGKSVKLRFYYDEIGRYNQCVEQFGEKRGEAIFFDDPAFKSGFPEFNSVFEKNKKKKKVKGGDILHYLIEYSDVLKKEKNRWMNSVLEVVRKTSLHLQPQLRTKIGNEGWASLWHERLFLADERIRGHEVDYALINARILADQRIGINPYAIGMHLFEFLEDLAQKGKLSYAFQRIKNSEERKRYDKKLGEERGRQALLEARKNFDDRTLINFLPDDLFQDFVDRYKLFVAGTRFNRQKFVVETYIKSRNGRDYREMLNKHLYHPPYVVIDEKKAKEGELYLDHVFEGRMLVTKYIGPVLKGLQYLWGGNVHLETTEFEVDKNALTKRMILGDPTSGQPEHKKLRVLYTASGSGKDRKLAKRVL